MHLAPDAKRPAGRLPLTLALWALATALVVALTARPTAPEVWEDECYWIGSAYYFDLAWRQRDWEHPDWQLLPARENPPVAKYVIGASLTLAGERIATPDVLGAFYAFFARVPGAWGEGEAREKRAAVVARMNPDLRTQIGSAHSIRLGSELFLPPRIAMLTCTVLASLILLLLARSAMSAAAALVASQVTLLHPVATEAMNHAMADAVCLLFSAAAAWATLGLLRALATPGPTRSFPVMRVLAAGALLGLACGAKMNALTVVLAAGAGLATFIALNPTLHSGLADGLLATVREHRLTAEIQTRVFGIRLDSPLERIEQSSTLFAFHPWAWLLLAAPALGCLASPRLTVRFSGIWWLLAWAAIVAWLPLAWLRYTAPLLLPTALVAGLALDALLRRVRPRPPASPASAART